MRRSTRKVLLNVILFSIVLFFILYTNIPRTNDSTFRWTTVRYQTTASRLPEARGICPGLKDTSKPVLVVSRVSADGDPTWLETLTDKYHLCAYTVDAHEDAASKHLQVPANRGHEAMAYLTFIIDNYENLPKQGAIFVHGSRWAWHNDHEKYDNAALLAMLNVSTALSHTGYHNLRCDWSASTCPLDTTPQGSVETSLRAMLEPGNQRVMSDRALPGALAVLFGGDKYRANSGSEQFLMGRHDGLRAQCCAQFVVSRQRMQQHTRNEYIALRQWLLDGTGKHTGYAAPNDDRIAGRILSYMWHILFLPQEQLRLHDADPQTVSLSRLNDLACPRADECYCRLYGRCGLQSCSAGRCKGQYAIPPGFRLPSNWGNAHSAKR